MKGIGSHLERWIESLASIGVQLSDAACRRDLLKEMREEAERHDTTEFGEFANA